jgi:hypothetical protein
MTGASSTRTNQTPIKVTKAVRDDVAGMLALIAVIPADLMAAADPYCSAVFAESMDGIIGAAVPIICRSQHVLQFMIGKQGFVLWARLAIACKPVVAAVIAHHITHSVDIVDGTVQTVDYSQFPAVA